MNRKIEFEFSTTGSFHFIPQYYFIEPKSRYKKSYSLTCLVLALSRAFKPTLKYDFVIKYGNRDEINLTD